MWGIPLGSIRLFICLSTLLNQCWNENSYIITGLYEHRVVNGMFKRERLIYRMIGTFNCSSEMEGNPQPQMMIQNTACLLQSLWHL